MTVPSIELMRACEPEALAERDLRARACGGRVWIGSPLVAFLVWR